MSGPSSPWPQYPVIPIFLDAPRDSTTPEVQETTKNRRPILHAITTPSTKDRRTGHYCIVEPPSEPMNFSLKVPSPVLSQKPVLRASTSTRSYGHFLSPESASSEPGSRSYASQFSEHLEELSPGTRPRRSWSKNRTGLGISHAPSLTITEIDSTPSSPCEEVVDNDSVSSRAPSTTSSSQTSLRPLILPQVCNKEEQKQKTVRDQWNTESKPGSSPNIATRIEQKLSKYNESKNVAVQWLLEISAWVISSLCMVAIIVMLWYLHGKEYSRWPLPHWVTLNAYIALLSKIASAALAFPVSQALGQLKWSWFQGDSKKMWDFEIFDNASRGAWGSLLLVIRTKCRSLAAVGAIITILTLGLDPFFQQIVDYPGKWSRLPETNSSIPVVVSYAPKMVTVYQQGLSMLEQELDFQETAEKFFFENGTKPVPFGNGTRPEIPVSCPTSKCTWPPYQTLGFCSQCADVSNLLTFNCMTATADWFSNLTAIQSKPTNQTALMCGYFVNATSNPVLMSGYAINPENNTIWEALTMRTMPLYDIKTRAPYWGGSINFKHIRNPISSFLVVGVDQDGVFRNETPSAHECVFSWCVRTLQSSYSLAEYTEETVAEPIYNTTEGPWPWNVTEFTSATGHGHIIYYTENITISPPQSDYGIPFGLGKDMAYPIIKTFDEFFPSMVTVMNSTDDPLLRYGNNDQNGNMERSFPRNPWALGNVSMYLDNMATAFTNTIRSSSSVQGVNGTAYGTTTFVEVRWQWLSLPLGLLFFSLIFLVATILKSSREKENQVGIWKTSAIATLFHGLGNDMRQTSTAMGTPRTKAKRLRMKWLSKGWRTSGSSFFPSSPRPSTSIPPTPAPWALDMKSEKRRSGWI